MIKNFLLAATLILPPSIISGNISVTDEAKDKTQLQEISITAQKIEMPLDPDEVFCLAQNIYHEARGETEHGMIAVANVTLNRVDDPHFPSSVCGVVYQARLWEGFPVRNACQFSWYCDGRSDTIKEMPKFKKIYNLAKEVMRGKIDDITDGSTFYHANYVDPYWSQHFTKVAQIDSHIFYRKY